MLSCLINIFKDKKRHLLFLSVIIWIHLSLVETAYRWLAPRALMRIEGRTHEGWRKIGFVDTIEELQPRPFGLAVVSDFSRLLWVHTAKDWSNTTSVNATYLWRTRVDIGAQNAHALRWDFSPADLSRIDRVATGMGSTTTWGTYGEFPKPLFRKSALRLDERLARFDLQQMDPLSEWTNTQILSPTTVQVLLEGDGTVLAASVVAPGSGVSMADQNALHIARRIRFQLVNTRTNSPLSWGYLDFVWRTQWPTTQIQNASQALRP